MGKLFAQREYARTVLGRGFIQCLFSLFKSPTIRFHFPLIFCNE